MCCFWHPVKPRSFDLHNETHQLPELESEYKTQLCGVSVTSCPKFCRRCNKLIPASSAAKKHSEIAIVAIKRSLRPSLNMAMMRQSCSKQVARENAKMYEDVDNKSKCLEKQSFEKQHERNHKLGCRLCKYYKREVQQAGESTARESPGPHKNVINGNSSAGFQSGRSHVGKV